MPIVTILPNETFCPEGAQIEVKTGAKLAQALNAAGIKIPHACEYNCACATCHVIVKEGFNSLNEPDDDEYDQLDNAFGSTPLSRLSCQTVMGMEAMSLKWKDAHRIAEELYDNEPDLDPVTLRLSELRERVLALPDFDDDPEKSNEPILEAILQAWLDER